jgi:hypothetical protein
MQMAPYPVDHKTFYQPTIVSPSIPFSSLYPLPSAPFYDQQFNREHQQQHINMFQGDKTSTAYDSRTNLKAQPNQKWQEPIPFMSRIKATESEKQKGHH